MVFQYSSKLNYLFKIIQYIDEKIIVKIILLLFLFAIRYFKFVSIITSSSFIINKLITDKLISYSLSDSLKNSTFQN